VAGVGATMLQGTNGDEEHTRALGCSAQTNKHGRRKKG
jgi:hypothetical protein